MSVSPYRDDFAALRDFTTHAFAELDPEGRQVRALNGRLLAATDTHLAFDTGT